MHVSKQSVAALINEKLSADEKSDIKKRMSLLQPLSLRTPRQTLAKLLRRSSRNCTKIFLSTIHILSIELRFKLQPNNAAAAVGSWIKDAWRNDRSLGFVHEIDDQTGMMRVHYPKTGKHVWVRWENGGHYRIINK